MKTDQVIVHKRRRPRHYRDNKIAPCGVRLTTPYPFKRLAQESYKWERVTCKNCLTFKIEIEAKKINKFDNSVVH